MNLATPDRSVQKLQTVLHAKAKSEPSYCFYSLWDKIYRRDVLLAAWRRVKANRGAAGVDDQTFEDIESFGLEKWLGKLEQEIREKTYRPNPLLRVWIPKSSGGQRPLSIPTIRDRVVQMCWYLVAMPIFEADFLPMQYGFRPNLDAKVALRRIHKSITKSSRQEVVDGDLKDYFNAIPHGPLLKSIRRRISDKNMLVILKLWLCAPVVENTKKGKIIRTTTSKDQHRGTAQGSVISPLMANVYFRRFLLAWFKFGYASKFQATVVNYADDFVICCRKGCAEGAMQATKGLMKRLGLELNEEKTKIANLPEESFDFLGYTFCQQFDKNGKKFIGTKPSKKSMKRIIASIHDETSRRWFDKPVESRITEINAILRGWSNYFNQGPVIESYKIIRRYTEKRLQRWLAKKHGLKGAGYKQFPEEHLYGTLGLFKLPSKMADVTRAKA